jgi:hypothetical protein
MAKKYALDYYPHEISENKEQIKFMFQTLDSATGDFYMQIHDNGYVFDMSRLNKRFAIDKMTIKNDYTNSECTFDITEIPMFHNNDNFISLYKAKPEVILKKYDVSYKLYAIKLSVIKEEFLELFKHLKNRDKNIIYVDHKLYILKYENPIKFLETDGEDIFNIENGKFKERMNIVIYAHEWKEEIYG